MDTLNPLAMPDTAAVAEPVQDAAAEPADDSPISCFSCQIGGQLFGIDSHHFCEVISQPAIAPLPGTSAWLLGLCNLRGNLVPVYQLHGALAAPLPPQPLVLIIGRGDQALGLVIDQLPVARQLDRDAPAPAVTDPMLVQLLSRLPHRLHALDQRTLCCLDAALLGPALRELAGQHGISAIR